MTIYQNGFATTELISYPPIYILNVDREYCKIGNINGCPTIAGWYINIYIYFFFNNY